MQRKKINDISEIWDGKKLLIKNFSNLDLSGLDLSIIPEKAWSLCKFYNTDFSSTNIKFKPNKLATTIGNAFHQSNIKGIFMSKCIFDNCDLSYLKEHDFYSSTKKCHVYYDGCSFKNTNFHVFSYLVDVIVDEYYLKKDYDDFDEFVKRENFTIIDINTIKKNPKLKVPSYKVLIAIDAYLYSVENKELQYRKNEEGNLVRDDFTKEKKLELVKECEELLKLDKQGYLKKIYETLKPIMNLDQKYKFFQKKIEGINIKDVVLNDIPLSLLYILEFSKNHFENVEVKASIDNLLRTGVYFLYDIGSSKNFYTNISFPNISYDSWQEIEGRRRISNGSITFLTKVYVELSRICNAKCSFCRNSSFDNCNYNFEKIKDTLKELEDYLNVVVIGGGEPTFRLDDAKKLYNCIDSLYEIDFHMFTNGTNIKFIDDEFIMNNFKINLSRHALKDSSNAKIFGINEIDIMTTKDIELLASKNSGMTLVATCFKGGLDNLEDIIRYINFAKEIGVKKVSFNDLHKDNSMGSKDIYETNLHINPQVFDDLINYLNEKGFRSKYPIYATGGYVSYIFKDKDDFSVTVQSYITKNELDNAWPSAIKRAFDLSIDPAGNLYENWHQQSNPVKYIGNKKDYDINIIIFNFMKKLQKLSFS